MKTLLLACLLSFMFWGREASAQSGAAEPDNYIVVIGAFSTQANADRFVNQSQKYKIGAATELNKIRNLYYVYVMQTGDKAAAMTEAERLRGATPYSGTWVYNGALGEPIVKKEPVIVVVEPLIEETKPIVSTPIPEPVDPAKVAEEKIRKSVEAKSMAMKKGETETLDYIFFYRDAAVLRPESRYEVDRLVQLLRENPSEKIRIHGHTNGNDKGKIIKLKSMNSDFFSLDNTVEDFGSAIELSELRASLIRDYLIKNGINKNRMSIKAWGGKKPIYKIDDDRAEANVRVEIEVTNND